MLQGIIPDFCYCWWCENCCDSRKYVSGPLINEKNPECQRCRSYGVISRMMLKRNHAGIQVGGASSK